MNQVASPPRIVLDTNVVFDRLVFVDPACALLEDAIAAGKVRWIATQAMHDEFFHVLGRGALDAWQPDVSALRERWSAQCVLVDPPAVVANVARLRCSDTDDQMFIDLALDHRVRWLLSKDRAVLKLAGRMRAFGVEVTTPAVWWRLIEGTTRSPFGGVSARRAAAASVRPAGR